MCGHKNELKLQGYTASHYKGTHSGTHYHYCAMCKIKMADQKDLSAENEFYTCQACYKQKKSVNVCKKCYNTIWVPFIEFKDSEV